MNIKIKFELEETELKGKIENLIPTTSGGSQDAVLYTAQTLTDEQKTQARANIGAGTSDFSGSYNDLIGSPEIPKSLSELLDDSDHRTVSDAEKESWNKKSNFSGDYDDLNNKPIIPEPYVLPAATAQTLGGVKIGDGISITEDGTISSEGSGGGSEWNLVLDTVINDNKEYQPLTLDYETGVMTFENGAPTDYPKGLIPNFQIGESTTDAWKYVPNEFLVPSDNQGWSVSKEGKYGEVTAISTGTVNSNVDVTKFHFENIASVAHTWNGLQCNKLKLEILAPNMKCWAYNSNIAFRLLLSDGSTYSSFTASETNPAHKSLQTFVGEYYIIHNKLWIKAHSRKNILKARTSTSVLGTITDSVVGLDLGRSLSDGVYIVGVETTSRSNQQSGMYNGTVIRIWEG